MTGESSVSHRTSNHGSSNLSDVNELAIVSEPLIQSSSAASPRVSRSRQPTFMFTQSLSKSPKRTIALLSVIGLIVLSALYILLFNNPSSTQTTVLQARIEQLQSRLQRLERLTNTKSHNEADHHADHVAVSDVQLLYPSPLSLPTPGHLKQLHHSTRPRAAIFTLITLHTTYCRTVWTLYKSLQQTDPMHDFDFVIMYEEKSQDKTMLQTDKFCSTLWAFSYDAFEASNQNKQSVNQSIDQPIESRTGRIRFMPVPTIEKATWHTIPDRWQYSMHRLEMFRVLDYEHSLFIDADTVAIHSLKPFFGLAYDLSAVVDQWDGCARREVMNGGLLSFRPSTYLYEALKMVFYSKPSCISETMVFSDQELINCLCGFAEAKKAAVRDLHCGLFPSWAAMYPSDAKCPQFRIDDVSVIHYAFYPKPWDWDHPECRTAAVAEGDPSARDAIVAAHPECHRLDEGEAFYMYWHCIDNNGALTIDGQRDCHLILNPKNSTTVQ